jgi:ABC-type microcin C transport system duplicated ATPase subunit YejF
MNHTWLGWRRGLPTVAVSTAPGPSNPPGPPLPAGSLVELRGVVKEYQSAAGRFTARQGVDLAVGASEFAGIVGKFGCGKSTRGSATPRVAAA